MLHLLFARVFAGRSRIPATILAALLVWGGGSSCSSTAAEVAKATADITVETPDRQIPGQLVSLDEAEVTIRTGDGKIVTLPTDSVRRIVSDRANGDSDPPLRLGLTGGSLIAASSIDVDDRRVKIQPWGHSTDAGPIELPTAQLRWIQFGTLNPPGRDAWRAMVEAVRTNDAMVIGRGDSLDSIEGTFLAMRDNRVQFDLGGEEVAAPIAKLRGVLLAGPGGSTTAAPAVRVTDAGGSRWAAGEVSTIPSDQSSLKLRMRLEDAVVELPWLDVTELRFDGAVLSLGGDPVEVRVEPPLGMVLPPELSAALGPIARPVGPSADSDPARMIDMSAPASMTFRVPSGFQTLRATVGWSPAVAATGTVEVSVRLDDEPAWQARLGGPPGEAAHGLPLGVEVPLGSARRVTLGVQAGDDGSAGDQVRWLNPRLIK